MTCLSTMTSSQILLVSQSVIQVSTVQNTLTGCMFSRAFCRWHVFPRLAPVAFSRAFHRLYVFPRLAPVACFPRSSLVVCFPALGTSCMFPALCTGCMFSRLVQLFAFFSCACLYCLMFHDLFNSAVF